jgi:hypothetical protein
MTHAVAADSDVAAAEGEGGWTSYDGKSDSSS